MDYQNIYDQLIQKARNEKRVYKQEVYFERHHIIPKCLGGEGKTSQWRTHPNIILLTAREHFIAHQLLCHIYPTNSKLKFALWAMCNQLGKSRAYKVSSKLYSDMKEAYIQIIKDTPKTEEHRKALSVAKKGIPRGPFSEEHISNLKLSVVGLKKSETHKKNLSKSKSVPRFQYSLDGTFIREWNSAKEAGMSLNIDSSDITRCCRGTKKTAGGFIWDNTLREVDSRLHRHNNFSSIVQTTKEGMYISTYISINEASRITGIPSGGISQCVQGKSKSCSGYVWIYEKTFLSLLNKNH